MVWFLLLAVAVAGILLAVKWNNFYGLSFALGFLAVGILVLVIIFTTAKFGTYQYQTQLEYYIYRKILKVKLNYYDLKRMANFGVWSFSVIMLSIAWKNRVKLYRRKNAFVYGGLLCLVSFWTLFLDSVRMHGMLYILIHTGHERMEVLETIIRRGELVVVMVCCAMPLWRIGCLLWRTRFRIRKRYLSAVWISAGILILLFFLVVLNAPLKYFLWNYKENDFHELYAFYQNASLISKLIWLFPMIMGIIVLLARFDILKEKSFVKKEWPYRNSVIRINDLRHVFHSYKNTLFSIECMCNDALEEYGKPESEKALRDILACAQSYRSQIGKFLNIYNRVDTRWDRFRMQDALYEARKKLRLAREVHVDMRIETEEDFIYGDREAVVEMFLNLFNNSGEAILKKDAGDGKIQIDVWTENELCCVSVWDNGEGMDKKTMRNLYTPFFTTKRTFQNWGIGMSQIRKTVDFHNGFIDVNSKVGKYAEIQIAFPMDL